MVLASTWWYWVNIGWYWSVQGRVPKTSSARRHCQPESFCASGKFLRVFTKLPIKCSLNINLRVNKCGKFQDSLESFRKVWKFPRRSRKFPSGLESFPRVWKLSERSRKFPDRVESFRTVWKLSSQFGMLWTVWKVSRWSGKFPDSPS